MALRRALATFAAVLALPAAALAEQYPDPPTLVLDGVRGAAAAQGADRRCPELYGGTAGLPHDEMQLALEEGLVAPLPQPAPGPVPAGLPRRVDLRTLTATFN